MPKSRCILLRQRLVSCRKYATKATSTPIISINEATFYRNHPSSEVENASANAPLFPGLNFTLPSNKDELPCWAIIGPSNAGKTTLLDVLRGKHVCIPPNARSFPYLASDAVEARHRSSARAIRYVGFDGDRGAAGKSGARGAYMTARYESRREGDDFSVLDFLQGNLDANPAEEQLRKTIATSDLETVSRDLRLQELLEMPMGNLSNGQIRRARIAKALLGKPLVLLLDEPFMGLDPPTVASLSPLLQTLAEKAAPRLILALRPQDPLPKWTTHLLELGPGLHVKAQGPRSTLRKSSSLDLPTVEKGVRGKKAQAIFLGLPELMPRESTRPRPMSREGLPLHHKNMHDKDKESVIEMKDIRVNYGQRTVLGNWVTSSPNHEESQRGFNWTVRKGDRWGVFGPNGSGKTTLISLICSDHPLSYSLSIKIFGRDRLPEPGQLGISIFDIQARIGQSSPEVHAFFPRNLSVRQVVENAWADTFLGTAQLVYENDIAVDACLRWFEAELNPGFELGNTPTKRMNGKDFGYFRDTDWADNLRFGDCPFSAQRVLLFLRAIVKRPELIVLDEAFSGMDEYIRDKCMLFLTWGETRTFGIRENDPEGKRVVKNTRAEMHEEPMFQGLQDNQTLICVSHIKEEVPGIVRDWVCLPDASTGEPARFGKFTRPLDVDHDQWKTIWAV